MNAQSSMKYQRALLIQIRGARTGAIEKKNKRQKSVEAIEHLQAALIGRERLY